MIITRYKVQAPLKASLKAAVVADLHGKYNIELIEALKTEQPDIIVCPGDLCTIGEYDDRLVDPERREKRLKTQDGALEFLREAVKIAPVYGSRGNHEWGLDDVFREAVKSTGAVLLENEWVKYGEIFIGGQNSAKVGAEYKDGKLITEDRKEPDIEWLKSERPDGWRLLLNHHPEYIDLIEPYADLIVSGHTHGSQAVVFGRGLFAPGQGWFPKYTKGQYGKMIVSAGLTNTTWVPRINNPCELVIVEMQPEKMRK